jgi:hypothetical protein
VAENGLAAGADLIEIGLEKDEARNRLRLTVKDNGRGLSPEDARRAADPFFTTRTTRKVGMGLSLLRQAAESCHGSFRFESELGVGATVTAEFELSHLDRAPLGDMTGTLMNLILGRPEVDFIYRQNSDGREFELDTREIKEALEGLPLASPEVLRFLKESLGEALAELGPI